MTVIRAETAGFCMGVGRALRKLDEVLRDGDADAPVFTFGPIIHNPQVLAAYAKQGVDQATDPETIPEGSIVVVRAHGVPKSIQECLLAKNITVVDATCPKVHRAQKLIARESEKGKKLLLYGEENHPEVKGLLSYAASGAHVFDSLSELKATAPEPDANCFLAAQTTQDKKEFLRIAAYIRDRLGDDAVILSTICDATRLRQEEAVKIAENVNFMVVVGGYESGNTRRLAQVVSAAGAPSAHVETAEELPLEELKGKARIGLTAGASTPKKIIDHVQSTLESL